MSYKVSAIVSCYKGEKYLPAFLENCAGQSIKDLLEIVLVLNEPSEKERSIVKDFVSKHPNLVNQIVVPREPLAVSTNRAIKAAKGEYVCIWNIDDLRTADSLGLMVKVLDENRSIDFTYGDYVIVKQWESKEGKLISPPEFDKIEFIQGMHLGPFYMWRKSLCEKIGYWDEQFKSGGDFDYAARLAVEAEGLKTKGLLGYYLDEGLGLSTGKTPWQPIERTVIELRFGVYHKLDFLYYNRAKEYKIKQILQDGVWLPVEKLMPRYKDFVESPWWAVYAVVRYPFWIIQRAINWAKRRI